MLSAAEQRGWWCGMSTFLELALCTHAGCYGMRTRLGLLDMVGALRALKTTLKDLNSKGNFQESCNKFTEATAFQTYSSHCHAVWTKHVSASPPEPLQEVERVQWGQGCQYYELYELWCRPTHVHLHVDVFCPPDCSPLVTGLLSSYPKQMHANAPFRFFWAYDVASHHPNYPKSLSRSQ